MKILKGFSAAPGIARGIVCVYSHKLHEAVPHYNIPKKQTENELKRLDNAFREARKKINVMLNISEEIFGAEGKKIISAHIAVLNDAGLRKKIEDFIVNNGINAEHAVQDVFDDYIGKLTGHGMHFEEISHDIKDVKDRLLESFGLESGAFICPAGEREAVVVASDRLTPSMILGMPRENILAIVTRQGGYTSHATILARSLDVPVIFGIDVEKELACQCSVIVDGMIGKVYVAPDEKTVKLYDKKEKLRDERKYLCRVKSRHPAQTGEGERIRLKVNISTLGELQLLKEYVINDLEENISYDGIGLLRTEFLFMKGSRAPTEDEQVSVYKSVVDSARGKHVVIRLLDLSPEKTPAYIAENPEAYSALGVRGAAAAEMHRELYVEQVRALLRTAEYGDIKILLPMVADENDIDTYTGLIDEASASLSGSGKKFRKPDIGIMFETPSSIILADSLYRKIDFANIGTNDLLQYTTASSRDSMISQQRYHILHPSVVIMIKMLTDAGKKHGKETCLCGEVGTFENYYPVLLDAGVRSFSVPVTKYDDIKCELLHISSADYAGEAERYLENRTREAQDRFFESL
ncbi:MAG: phosphoenolpyruvate--protein phosphotransferase [Elusimicrobia bacterium]|nr:phosphoenolpyruvate--protein phosphotransferase [Elusimicrobiota bacterium]